MQSLKLLESRREAFSRQLGICFWCGRAMAKAMLEQPHSQTADHLILKSKGGTLDQRNIVCACLKCNNERGNMDLFEWLNIILKRVSTQHFSMILAYLSTCGIVLGIGPPQRATVETGLTANEGKSRHGFQQSTSDA
jgi:hypothetical protein